jgi:hypothetical protein
VTPEELRSRIQQARDAAAAHLRRRSVDDVLRLLDRVIGSWLRPGYPPRRRAEELLPLATGFSTEMIRHGLPLLLAPLRADAVRALLTAELGDYRVLDGTCNGRRATGPGLITHVMSGNIPALSAVSVVLSLAIKSAVLVKSAAGDPVFPALLAASISEVDEALGRCVVVANWRGGDREIEDIAFTGADLVVASGSDAAIAAIAPRVSGRFIGHSHKVSFAIIGTDRLSIPDMARRVAARLAYDVSLWDQQGCLSPQLCYVEAGGSVCPEDFAALLAEALARYASALPPRQLAFAEQAAVLRFRQEAEWQQAPAGALLASPASTAWSISVEHSAGFAPTCLNRCIRVKCVTSLSELPPALAAHRRQLEAAGVAVAAERLGTIVELLSECGVHRVCPLGTMQLPPLWWRQSGRPRVADWVEWVGVEDE